MADMELIWDILDISHGIYLIYLELYRLEVNGNKGNTRYLSLIQSLKDKIKEEKELYELLSQDIDSFNMLLDYVKTRSTELLFLRIYSYMVSKEVDDDKLNKIHSACSKDLFLVYLSFLGDYIDNEDYVLIRNGIIYTKYYNLFINLDVEEYLILNNLKISKINYVSAPFISKILLMDEREVGNDILDCYKDAIVVAIINLLNICNSEYNNMDKMIDVVSSMAMIRAGLSILDNDCYDVLIGRIYRIIDEMSTKGNSMSVKMINSIVDGRNIDKRRVKKINIR